MTTACTLVTYKVNPGKETFEAASLGDSYSTRPYFIPLDHGRPPATSSQCGMMRVRMPRAFQNVARSDARRLSHVRVREEQTR
jgi:hypothetical protein